MFSYQNIGQFKKPHGLGGHLKADVPERYAGLLTHSNVLFIEEEGHHTPYFIEEAVLDRGWIIKLEEVEKPEQAARLSGKEIYVEAAEQQEEAPELIYDTLVGYDLWDKTQGQVGKVQEIIELPHQIMAMVSYADREIMIPINEQLIEEVDSKQQIIRMDLPEGLLNL